MVKSMIEKMLIIKLKKGNVNLMRVRGVSIQRTQVENEHVVLLNSEYFTWEVLPDTVMTAREVTGWTIQ